MPNRNIVKDYIEESYYHVYNRGVNKRKIFIDNDDYAVFLNLLKRYLDIEPAKDSKGREYKWLHKDLELLAFCLVPNHFHLFLYQHDKASMTELMRAVCASYTTYFNKKYGRVGPLLQGRFRATRITNDSYLQHISRYIHLNNTDYSTWEFSSYPYYVNNKKAGWVRPGRILRLFENDDYKKFVADYKENKAINDEIKRELADS